MASKRQSMVCENKKQETTELDSEPTVVRRCSGPKRLGPHEVPIPAPQGGKVLQGSTEDLAEESSGEDVGWRLPVIATRRVLGREDEPSVLEMDLDVYSICSLGNMIQSDEIRLLRRLYIS
ncbi:hypothetical protein AAG570_002907 [Ranatra chinensis]|uniref:Uncharacterized protein n=1 Tax=Ranatra chinensis TaxID=642074 RepID=A0ABD0YHM9_9HEMI